MQVWTSAPGQVASIASRKPVSPSQHTINTSWTPRLASCAHTDAQNLAPSDAWTQIPVHVFDAVEVDTDRDVGMTVHDPVLVTDLDHQRVEVDHRVERLQRPVLPRGDLVGHRFGHIRDGLMRQVGPQRRRQVVLDLTG